MLQNGWKWGSDKEDINTISLWEEDKIPTRRKGSGAGDKKCT